MPPATRNQVFISYSHEDTKWRKDLEKHLKPYLRAGSIKSWSDAQISPGSQWFTEITAALTNTKVAVLLVSPDFIASDFIHEDELAPFLKEAERGGVTILWVPVYPSAYIKTALNKYQAVLNPETPLAAMTKVKRAQAWVRICEEIEKAVKRGPAPISGMEFDGIEFVLIQAGKFQMGSTEVHISQPFYLGKYPVTQAQWAALMGNNPSKFRGDSNRPVEMVSWEEVKQFIRDLNAGKGSECYRLPTEAEWEYACRAGSTTAYCFGDDEKQLGEYAWYKETAREQTHPVGKLKANAWGLYDMHGNVWEFVQDWYTPEVERVDRGGSWVFDASWCRSASRGHITPGHRADDTGFRLLKTAL